MSSSALPPQVTVPAFPTEVTVSSEESSSTSSISGAEAEHRRLLQKWTSGLLLLTLLVANVGAGYVLYQTLQTGTAETQKLAFGFIGTILGVLWSNYGKLVEYASKR